VVHPEARSRGVLLFAIVAGVGLVARLAYVFQARVVDPVFHNPVLDGMFHHQWAQAIVRGGWLAEMPFFRAPLYPYFLAGIYRVFGAGLLAPRLVQAVLGSLSCGVAFLLGRRLFGNRVGLAAGTATAVYPMLVYFDGELLMPSLLVFLVLSGMVLLYRSRDSDRWWFLPGLAWGLAAITRPNVLVFVVLLAAWFALEFRRGMWRRYLLFLAGVVVVILPVTIRNYVVSHEVIPIAWQAGVNFYIGNNPQSDGVTAVVPGTRKDWWGGFYDTRRLAEEAEGRELDYSGVDRYWLGRGLRFWQERPAQATRLLLRKLYLFFSGYETANNRDVYFFSRFTFLGFLLCRLPGFVFPFGLLVPLAAAAAVIMRRRWRRLLPLYLFCGGVGLSFAAFFVNARFRMPLVPLVLVLASGGVAVLVSRRRSGWLVPLVVFVLCYVPLNLNLANLRGTNEAQVYSMLAGHEVTKGDDERAEEFLQRARAADPGWADQYFVAGLLARRRGDDSEAERMFQMALLHDSTNADYWVYFGDLKYGLGELDTAALYYRRALEFDPYSAFAFCHLGNVQFDRGDYGAALVSYRTATELIPDYTVAIYNVGLVHYQVGEHVRAREWWQRVVETDPDHRLSRQVEPWLKRYGSEQERRD